ncbi:MAG: hypothetical protein F4070_08090, partial [Acidimicrobiales bacterium]|nr:hypothetical protein [Acidimicrobiales bacterium]
MSSAAETAAAEKAPGPAGSGSAQRGRRGPDRVGRAVYRFLRSIPAWVLWLMVIVWSVPTGSLFLNSFRHRDDQRASGWWTSFTEGNWTLENYADVLSSGEQTGGLWQALLNSFAIAIPATIIPIAIATLAA